VILSVCQIHTLVKVLELRAGELVSHGESGLGHGGSSLGAGSHHRGCSSPANTERGGATDRKNVRVYVCEGGEMLLGETEREREGMRVRLERRGGPALRAPKSKLRTSYRGIHHSIQHYEIGERTRGIPSNSSCSIFVSNVSQDSWISEGDVHATRTCVSLQRCWPASPSACPWSSGTAF